MRRILFKINNRIKLCEDGRRGEATNGGWVQKGSEKEMDGERNNRYNLSKANA